jgi:hypothetical protein
MCQRCDATIATTILLIEEHQRVQWALLAAHALHALAPTPATQHRVQALKVETCLANERIRDAVGGLPGDDDTDADDEDQDEET